MASYKTVKNLADSLGVDTDDIINMEETIYEKGNGNKTDKK